MLLGIVSECTEIRLSIARVLKYATSNDQFWMEDRKKMVMPAFVASRRVFLCQFKALAFLLTPMLLGGLFLNETRAEDGDLKSITQINCPNQNVEVFKIQYKSGEDQLRIHGYLVIPKGIGNAPCVIYNRGGNNKDDYNSTGDDDFGHMNDQFACNVLADVALRNGEDIQGGFVVIASQYRGFGQDGGQHPTDVDEFGGRDVEDVLNLIKLLDNFESGAYRRTVDRGVNPPVNLAGSIDPSRIAMFGWSRGGMMTYLALRRLRERSQQHKIKTAIVGAGLADLFDSEMRRPGLATGVHQPLIPCYDDNRHQVLKDRSAVFWADQLPRDIPILLLHGTADSAVDISQARRMYVELHRHTREHAAIFVEGVDHGFRNGQMFRPLRTLMVSKWLQTHLR